MERNEALEIVARELCTINPHIYSTPQLFHYVSSIAQVLEPTSDPEEHFFQRELPKHTAPGLDVRDEGSRQRLMSDIRGRAAYRGANYTFVNIQESLCDDGKRVFLDLNADVAYFYGITDEDLQRLSERYVFNQPSEDLNEALQCLDLSLERNAAFRSLFRRETETTLMRMQDLSPEEIMRLTLDLEPQDLTLLQNIAPEIYKQIRRRDLCEGFLQD